MLCGGFLKNDSVLVTGPSGSGKTTLGMEFLYKGAHLFDEPGLFISFEELPEKIQQYSVGFGWNLKKLETQDCLRIICTSPSVFLEQIKTPENLFDQIIEELGVKRVFIDGLRALELEIPNVSRQRKMVYCILNHFTRSLKTTTMLSYEIPSLFGFPKTISHSGVDFLADCIIVLIHTKRGTELGKAIIVLKMRGSDHDKSIKHVMIGRDGLEVQAKLEVSENLLEDLSTLPLKHPIERKIEI